MAKRLATRNNDNKQKNPTKPIEEIKSEDINKEEFTKLYTNITKRYI